MLKMGLGVKPNLTRFGVCQIAPKPYLMNKIASRSVWAFFVLCYLTKVLVEMDQD